MTSMMTVEQAADKLQVKPNTIRTWIKQGRIPGRKIGRIYRIPEQALDQLCRWIIACEAGYAERPLAPGQVPETWSDS